MTNEQLRFLLQQVEKQLERGLATAEEALEDYDLPRNFLLETGLFEKSIPTTMALNELRDYLLELRQQIKELA